MQNNLDANQAKCIHGKLERGNKSVPERTIKWQNKPHTGVGRQSTSNIILGSPGVRNEFKDRLSPKAAWKLLFTFDMLMTIVEMTNKKINSVKRSLPERVLDDGRITFLHSTNACAILALIGIIYWRGLLGQAKHKIDKLFHNLSGSPIFGATMSKNRFRFLMSHISFDDFASRNRR